jgi:transcriptional regulator with PAS, ATPase and Fis domain
VALPESEAGRPAASPDAVQTSGPLIVGDSQALRDVCAVARRVAASDAKVLITGESGVGKDLIARLVHWHSKRASGAYIAVNCAAFTESLLESELFGHVRGSFTDAVRDSPGKLLLAHKGSIFLDEVGEMSLRMQALLLRFLESGEIQPVGADGPRAPVDVRVIAATNRNLQEAVASGQFREDLLYRLDVVHIHVPPLRERPEDVRALVAHMLATSERQVIFDEGAMKALETYRWPGNVRELQNVVERLVWTTAGDVIGVDDLPRQLRPSRVERLVPAHERRRQMADDLFRAITDGTLSFWSDVHRLFLDRDLTRHDIRELVRRGLVTTRGNYRSVVDLFGMPPSDYKRFLNFLTTHDCVVDYRPYRSGGKDSAATKPHRVREDLATHLTRPSSTSGDRP